MPLCRLDDLIDELLDPPAIDPSRRTVRQPGRVGGDPHLGVPDDVALIAARVELAVLEELQEYSRQLPDGAARDGIGGSVPPRPGLKPRTDPVKSVLLAFDLAREALWEKLKGQGVEVSEFDQRGCARELAWVLGHAVRDDCWKIAPGVLVLAVDVVWERLFTIMLASKQIPELPDEPPPPEDVNDGHAFRRWVRSSIRALRVSADALGIPDSFSVSGWDGVGYFDPMLTRLHLISERFQNGDVSDQERLDWLDLRPLPAKEEPLPTGPILRLDLDAGKATWDGQPLKLSPSRFTWLRELAEAWPYEIVTKKRLQELGIGSRPGRTFQTFPDPLPEHITGEGSHHGGYWLVDCKVEWAE